MPDFSLSLIISSFIAGVLTFFAACTFPLIPAFLGVISGVGQNELTDSSKLKNLRWKIFTNAIFYALGFSLIFILFGIAFSSLGRVIVFRELIQRIGGVFVIVFGLFLLGWLKIPWLLAEKQIRSPKLFRRASRFNSFLIGALFALGWSPCVGPLLGSVLLLATTTGTIFRGTFLLVIFSAGLAVPFLLTALLVGRAFDAFNRWRRLLGMINIVSGIFLVILGILLISGQFTVILNSFKAWFSQFQFYEEFINKFL